MTDTAQLRTVIAGLLGFAAAEQEMLLAAVADCGEADELSGPDRRRWPAWPGRPR